MYRKVAYFIAAIIFGAAQVFGAMQMASAADMPVKAPAAPAAAPIYSWTGFYIGGMAGYVWGRSQHCDTPVFCTDTFNVDGFTAGGTAGYNWQWTNWVFGLETDFSYANAKGSTVSIPGVFGCGTPACDTKLDWFGTVRGRVGLAYDRFLPYVTGGFAYGKLYADLGTPPLTTSNSDTKSGWTVGGGLEYALPMPNWSAKLEYLYFRLGDLFYDTARICGQLSCTAVHNNFSVLRLGVNYRF